jgi:predicted nuclease with TOPRIM domain
MREMNMDDGIERDDASPELETEESCPSCQQFFATDRCSGEFVPLTRDEEAILARMREVKARVTEVKQQIRELEGQLNGESLDRLGERKQRLEALRREWQGLDRQRQEAAHVRMQLLGHEE